jgi:hypothetical protein
MCDVEHLSLQIYRIQHHLNLRFVHKNHGWVSSRLCLNGTPSLSTHVSGPTPRGICATSMGYGHMAVLMTTPAQEVESVLTISYVQSFVNTSTIHGALLDGVLFATCLERLSFSSLAQSRRQIWAFPSASLRQSHNVPRVERHVHDERAPTKNPSVHNIGRAGVLTDSCCIVRPCIISIIDAGDIDFCGCPLSNAGSTMSSP